MLHIIKQFVFGLTLMLKAQFNNGDQFDSAVTNLDSDNEKEAVKATLEINDFLRSLDGDNDKKLSSEEVGTTGKLDITKAQINQLLEKIGVSPNSNEIFLGQVEAGLIKFQEERGVTLRESQLQSIALKQEIDDATPDLFSEAIIDSSLVSEGFKTINKRGTFNSEVIGTYLHDGDQKDIKMKKDGKGKYYIELDGSVTWGNDIVSETTDIQTEQKVEELLNSILNGNIIKNNSINTEQVVDNKDDNTVIKTGEIITEKDDINYNSLNKIISGMSFSELKELKLFFENNTRKAEWSKMRSLGYDPDGMFGNFEMEEIINLVSSVIENQEKLQQSNDFREKLKIIFDYNADGILDSKGEFYTEEKEIFQAVENEQQFENILKNLGYTDKAQFDAEFNENYYVAREKFKNLLAVSLGGDYVLDPALMMEFPNAKAELNTQLQAIDDRVTADMSMNQKVQQLSSEYPLLAQQFQENTKSIVKNIYLQSLSGIVGGAVGLGASFNVEGLTEGIIDSASIGIINGILGLQVSKEFFRSYDAKTSASIGLVNFIPYISASHELYEEKVGELKNIFQTKEIDNGSKVTLGGGGTLGAGIIGLNYEKVDEETSEGREQLREKSAKMIKDIIDTFADDISTTDALKELGIEDTEENRNYYDQIQAMYLATGANEISKQEIVTGFSNNYERVLAQDNQGLTLSGVSLGLAYSTLTGILPFIGVHGEYSSVDWEEKRFVIDKIKPVAVVAENAGEVYESTAENMDFVLTELSQYESGFSHRTRYNTGAEGFLDPTNSIQERWESLKVLSTAPKALRDINLHDYLLSNDSAGDDIKLAIISVLGAWTRKSNDVKGANTPEKLIDLDNSRREGFNNNFGFDVSGYAQEYYKQLEQQDKIYSTQVYGSSFDAVSILNVEGQSVPNEKGDLTNRVSGIDMLHGPLRMVADAEGNPIQVEITNTNHIKAFAESIQSLADNNGEKMKEFISMVEQGQITLYFYKDPDGFNDRIIPVINETPVETTTIMQSDKSVTVYNPVLNATPWSLFAIPSAGSEERSGDGNGDGSLDDNAETRPGNDTGGDSGSGVGNGDGGFGSIVEDIPEPVINNIKVDIDTTNAGAAILTQDQHNQNAKK